MARAIVKFQDKSSCNLEADRIDADAEYVSVFKGSTLVGIFRLESLDAAFVSEKNETGGLK